MSLTPDQLVAWGRISLLQCCKSCRRAKIQHVLSMASKPVCTTLINHTKFSSPHVEMVSQFSSLTSDLGFISIAGADILKVSTETSFIFISILGSSLSSRSLLLWELLDNINDVLGSKIVSIFHFCILHHDPATGRIVFLLLFSLLSTKLEFTFRTNYAGGCM